METIHFLTDGIAYTLNEEMPSPPFQPLTALPLVVMVGLTGVGKTTTLKALRDSGVDFTLLPNRRAVTDALMIAYLQQQAGQAVAPVADRLDRFAYTARYRERFSGGMAHALTRLAIEPAHLSAPLVFDGLRGLNEARYAVEHFPHSSFVLLDAPNPVRLQRLLNRADPFDQTFDQSFDQSFDQTAIQTEAVDQSLLDALTALPHIEAAFSRAQLEQIARVEQSAPIAAGALLKKVSIIVEESKNYQPGPTRNYLASALSAERALLLDTERYLLEGVVKQIVEWLD